MKINHCTVAVTATLFLGLAALPAHATTVLTTDILQWNSLISTPGATVNFTNFGLTPGTQDTSYSNSTGLTVSPQGVTFIGVTANGGFDLSLVNATSAYNNWGTGTLLAGPATATADTSYIQVNFSAPVTAFSFNGMTYGSGSHELVFTLSTGEIFNHVATNVLPSAPSFFGFTSDTAISSLRIASVEAGGSKALIDNLILATAGGSPVEPLPSDTPEAMTMLLIGSGLACFRFGRRFLPQGI